MPSPGSYETKTVIDFDGTKRVARVPSLWYAASSSLEKGGKKEDESDGREVDELPLDEAESPCCGDGIYATCPAHGMVEIAKRHRSTLRCCQWEFETGRECRHILIIQCASCMEEVAI